MQKTRYTSLFQKPVTHHKGSVWYCSKGYFLKFFLFGNYFKSSNKIPKPICLKCGHKTCHKLSFYNGYNNNNLLHTILWDCSSNLKEQIP
jgi:hypothetical protein